jgi:hypothetical protein
MIRLLLAGTWALSLAGAAVAQTADVKPPVVRSDAAALTVEQAQDIVNYIHAVLPGKDADPIIQRIQTEAQKTIQSEAKPLPSGSTTAIKPK